MRYCFKTLSTRQLKTDYAVSCCFLVIQKFILLPIKTAELICQLKFVLQKCKFQIWEFQAKFNPFKIHFSMGHFRALFRLFSVFSNKHYSFYNNVKICPSNMWYWDLNSQSLEKEYSPITTRPGHPPASV